MSHCVLTVKGSAKDGSLLALGHLKALTNPVVTRNFRVSAFKSKCTFSMLPVWNRVDKDFFNIWRRQRYTEKHQKLIVISTPEIQATVTEDQSLKETTNAG